MSKLFNHFGRTYNAVFAALFLFSLFGGNAGAQTNTFSPPAESLVGWWRGDGNANDSAGTNNGTLLGMGFTTGVYNQAFAAGDGNKRVLIPDNPVFQITNSLTMAAWVNPSGYGQVILFRGDSRGGLDPYQIGLDTSSRFGLIITDATNQAADVWAPNPLPYNQWTHVAATLDGSSGSMRVYINGVLKTENFTSIRPFGALNPSLNPGVSIGNVTLGYNFPFRGGIDEVLLYSRALSPDEIMSLVTATNAPPAITAQPTDETVIVGGTATFTVTATGTAPLSYQWQFNGADLPGQTSNTLALVNVQTNDAGNYSVTVTNVYGAVSSSNAFLTVTPAVPSYSPPANGLVGWWRGDGNANDSASTNNGTLLGMGFTTGVYNQAFAAGNGNKRVLVPDNPVFQLTNSLTMAAWVNPSAYGQVILFRGDSRGGLDPYQIGLDTSSRFGLIITDATNHAADVWAPTPLAYNQWTHVAATLDGSTGSMRVYINGVLKSENFTSVRPFGALNPSLNPGVSIGNVTLGYDFPFRGGIDEVLLYSRALSPDEIMSLVTAPQTPPAITDQPTDETVIVGDTATFTVTATGSPHLSYQWQFNGADLPGQISSTLALVNVQTNDAGNYSVTVTNPYGSVSSSSALLTVLLQTDCVPSPAGLVAWWRAEASADDSAGANNGTTPFGIDYGTGRVGQAFNFDGSLRRVFVPDSPAFKLTNSMTIEGWINPRQYNNGFICFRGDSRPGLDPWVLTINAPNQIVFQVCDESNNSLALRGPIQTNQWQHVAATLDGATGSMRIYVNGSLLVQTNTTIRPFADLNPTEEPGVGIGNASGTHYQFPFVGLIDEISLYGRALSAGEVLSLYAAGTNGKCVTPIAPSIVSQPADQTVTAGNNATFTVVAAGTTPLSYQWQFNGVDLSGQTGNSLVLLNVQTNDAGNYSVLVTNSVGSVLSSNALLTVAPPGPPFSPITNGLVGWWRGDGNANDSGGTNNGTLLGMGFANGVYNQAFAAGNGRRVLIPDNPALQLTNSLTMAAWVNPSEYGQVILFRGDSRGGYDPYQIGLDTSSRFGLIIDDATRGSADVWAATPLPYNQWTHVAATLDGSTGSMRAYTNGVLANEVFTSVRPFGALNPSLNPGVSIGNVTLGYDFPFRGGIDEVLLYSRALSPDEVMSLAAPAMPATSQPAKVQPFGDLLSVTPIAGGVIVRFAGAPGATYTLQRSPSPYGPWTTVAPVIVGPSGIGSYTDTDAPPGNGYYRTIFVP